MLDHVHVYVVIWTLYIHIYIVHRCLTRGSSEHECLGIMLCCGCVVLWLCCVVLSCAMLCCVKLWCVVLCCVVLC